MADEPVNERPIFPAVVREDARGFGIWATSMIRQLTTVFQQYGYRLNKALLDDDLVKNGGDVLSTDDYQANGGDVLTADDYQANGGDLYTEAQVDALVAGQATGWLTPTLENGWVNYGGIYASARYRRRADGVVEIRVMVKDGTAADGTTVFALPAGFRPSNRMLFPVVTSSSQFGRVDVVDTGQVQVYSVSNTYMAANFSFQADQ